MKHLLFTIIASMSVLVACAITPAEVVNPHTANRYDFVSDMANVITSVQEDSINSLCMRLDSLVGMELAVVTIDSLDGQDSFQFSVDVYQSFGIGKNDNGILIFVAVSDHKWEIRTGYTAEGTLTDALCSNIGRNYMVPKFRSNDYGGGILDAVKRIYEVSVTPEAMEALETAVAEEGGDYESILYILAAAALLFGLIAYLRERSRRPKCPHCGSQNSKKMSSKTIENPTYTQEGKQENTYKCKKCGAVFVATVVLAKLIKQAAVSHNSGIGGGGFGGGSGSGGGFSGGSFGGGSTGGGGAGGSW